MAIDSNHEADFDDFAAGAWPRLLRAARLLVDDPHTAEDLAQTALARTFAVWRRVRRDDAYAFARRVMVNASIDRHRRRRWREVQISDSDDREPAIDDATVVESRDEIARLLSTLTRQERAIVVLRYYCDLSIGEVAAELQASTGTVKSTASRALSKLRVVREGTLAEEQP